MRTDAYTERRARVATQVCSQWVGDDWTDEQMLTAIAAADMAFTANTARDISEDVAKKVLALECDEGHIVSQEFLENSLGCEAVAEALREIGQ
jgi:hypothetical protein